MSPPDRPSSRGGDTGDWVRVVRDSAPYLGLGATLAATVFAGLGGGYWLDGRLGTRPLFLILGGVFGVGAGLYHFFKTVAGSSKRQTDHRS